MRVPKQTSFPAFELVIVAALALIGWAAFRLYEIVPGVGENRKMIEDLREEYAQIGEYVPPAINDLDGILNSYLKGGREGREELVKNFDRKSVEFSAWLREERRRWSSRSEP